MAKPKKESPVKTWRPAPPEWIETFAKGTAGIPGGEQRKMFGYPALFANGNMAAGLHGSGLVLRLPDAEREALLRLPGAHPFEPMPGRVMREYVVAPAAFVKKPSEVSAWLRKAFAYASTLEPKTRARKKQGGRRAD